MGPLNSEWVAETGEGENLHKFVSDGPAAVSSDDG